MLFGKYGGGGGIFCWLIGVIDGVGGCGGIYGCLFFMLFVD